MKKSIKKLILSGLCLLVSFGYIFAETPDNFSIEVSENVQAGESVDFTIAAMKNGEILKDYTGSVIFWVNYANGNLLSEDYYTVPNGSWYNFDESDLGKKTFSKGLSIKLAGSYKLIVTSLGNDSSTVTAEALINVSSEDDTGKIELITINYPSNSSTESKSFVNVLGSCPALKNSPVILYLNGKQINSGQTDSRGDFNILVADLLSGENEIQAKIIDLNNVVLGESASVFVRYQPPQDGFFKSMEILPGREGKQGEKFIFNVNTDDEVSSVQLMFSNGLKYSMDRVSQGIFSKEIVATFSGDVDISISLSQNGDEKIYENIDQISIDESIAITNIKFEATGLDNSDLIISWDTLGDVSKYQINYGTGRENLSSAVTVSSSTVSVKNIDKNATYFFQIIPMDEESHNSGDPSEIVEYRFAALACVVKGIKVKTEHIGDNYYLVWDPVENATSYEVYKSEWADMTNARLVGSLTGTRFQYLFDPNSEKDEYAYYQVQALCPDGKNVVVDNAKKVKVGPFENTLLIIVISIFVYSMYRLNRLSNNE